MHDVGYRECLKFEDFSIHQFISADIANEYLTSAGYPSERRFEMVKAISRHNLTDKLRERKDK